MFFKFVGAMIKKILIIASLLIVGCKQEKKEPIVLLDYVPQNTIAVFQLNDQNMLENAMKNLPFLDLFGQINNSLYQDIKAVVPDKYSPNALICLTPEGKDNLALSFIYKSTSYDSLNKKNSDQVVYNDIKIYVEKLKNRNLYHSRIRNINLISTSQLLLENSIRIIKNKKRGVQNSSFYRLAKLSDINVPLNIYLQNDIKILLKRVFSETDLFPFMGSDWFSFDFNNKKNPFTLDGLSFINDSISDNISLLKGLEPKRLNSPEYIPRDFDSYLTLAISDYKTLEDNFKKYSRYENIPLSKINFDILGSVDEISWIKKNSNQALYLHLNNAINIPLDLFSNSKPSDNFRKVNIKDQGLPKDLNSFLEAFGMPFNPSKVAKLGDFLVYTSSKPYLKELIGAYLDKNTLSSDLNFKSLLEDLADNSTFLWVGNTQNLKNRWKQNTKKNKKIWENIKLEKYPLIAIQGVSEKEFVQSRFTAQKDNTKQEKNSVTNQYSFNLDAPLLSKPQWIKNHRNKTMDVVVQDENNVLYLFSNKGTLFWKKQLSGPIIGNIKQVDLYKNRRLQMAFRTADSFIILDRNGKVVSPFNKTISSETPHHLAVFDYDLNRNYRFLLSHGKKLEMYDNRGKRVSGFRLKELSEPLQHPPKHIRLGTKDYIVLKDIDGQIRILNRQGKDRVKLKKNINSSPNPVFEYRNTFTTTSKEGSLIQIDYKGNLIESSLQLLPGHKVDMTSKSLVTLSENKLIIKGIPVILPFGNYTSPKIHYINNTIYVTLTDLDDQKVYAFYSNGSPVGGFPVYGSSAVALSNSDNDKALEMVVKSEEDGLIIYQIN